MYEYTASASIGGTKYTYGLMLIKSGGEYYLFNGHGDVVQLANTSGTVTKTYRYNAFGEEQNILAADTNPFRYCGQYYDVETGTIYLRARYYDPDTGRFTQEDDRKYSFPQNLLSLL